MSSYIHFIRHGITEGIVNKWYYGSADLPLIDEGYVALREFMNQGIYPPLGDADCYTSGMLRADQTLQTIYGDVSFTAIPLLREMNFGNWECKTFEELQSEPEYEEWMNNTEGSFHYPGGGDSVLTFYERIQDGLKELCGYHRLKELSHRHSGQDAVSIMVCHGGTIAAAMEHWFPGERENFWQWIPATGRGFTVEFKEGEPFSYKAI